MKKIISTLSALILLVVSTTLAQNTELKLNFKKGDGYSIKIEMDNLINQEVMGNKMEVTQNYTFVSNFNTKDILPNGNYSIEQTYKRILLDVSANGQSLKYDTDNADAASPMAAVGKLMNATISYELSPKGKISNIKGLNEIITQIGNSPQTQGIVKSIASTKTLESSFSYIPDVKIKTGDSYSKKVTLDDLYNMKITTDYTVKSITPDVINLSVNSDFTLNPEEPIVQNGVSMKMNGKGTQSGSYDINAKTGLQNSSNVKQVMDMTLTVKNPQTGEDMDIPMKVTSLIKSTATKL